MAKKDNKLKLILILSLLGTLFAGYLTFTKIFTGKCALNEPCPYVLGYPACLYGFILFLSMFIISILTIKKYNISLIKAIVFISLFGIIFSGVLSIKELFFTKCIDCNYSLLLPSCVYGLIFYIIIFIISLKLLNKK